MRHPASMSYTILHPQGTLQTSSPTNPTLISERTHILWWVNYCWTANKTRPYHSVNVRGNIVFLNMMTSSNGSIFRVIDPLCGKSPVTGELSAQKPVTRSFDVFFGLRMDKRLSKQGWDWWFGTPSRPLWRHCNAQKDTLFLPPERCLLEKTGSKDDLSTISSLSLI